MVVALTILGHADLHRVGQVARLTDLDAGRTAAVSRTEPRFAPLGDASGEGLADPLVPRKALSITRREEALVIEVDGACSLAVDGVVAKGRVDVAARALAEGVVLEVAGRVVLLLHTLREASGARAPRFGLVGDSDALEDVRRDIARVADLDGPVLLRGAAGSGKEIVARAIHKSSRRRAGPCVSVSVESHSEAAAVSELFGHARGAPGSVVRADRGTLFLDGLGETSTTLQGMLLRAIDRGEVMPEGATSPRKVDVRVIAATDVDLDAAVRAGGFDGPLRTALAEHEIALPPLRARRDDIGRLFVHFLRAELTTAGEAAKLEGAVTEARPYVSSSLVASLARYAWPGNVRQLRNVTRQLVVASRGESKLVVTDAVERLLSPPPEAPPAAPEAAAAVKRRPSEITDDVLLAALRANGWRREPTARQLGIAVSSLYGLIDRCALLRKANEISRDELERCREACKGDLAAMSAKLEVSTRGLQLRMRELGMV